MIDNFVFHFHQLFLKMTGISHGIFLNFKDIMLDVDRREAINNNVHQIS